MALKIDAKFEGKPTYAFKNVMRDLSNFQKLKNSNFILESNMANQIDQMQCENFVLPWK